MTKNTYDGASDEPKAIEPPERDTSRAKRLFSILVAAEEHDIIVQSPIGENTQMSAHPSLGQRALEILASRRRRHSLFGKAMFGEPAWEILLLLSALGSPQTITQLAKLARASKSTAIRWIDYLEGQRLVARQNHPTDKRAVVIELTEEARESIAAYLFAPTILDR